jgi:hypothetical protein
MREAQLIFSIHSHPFALRRSGRKKNAAEEKKARKCVRPLNFFSFGKKKGENGANA